MFSCSDKKVEKSTGKPYRFFLKKYKIKPSEAIVIGDKISADYIGAKRLRCISIKFGIDDLDNWKKEKILLIAGDPLEIIPIDCQLSYGLLKDSKDSIKNI